MDGLRQFVAVRRFVFSFWARPRRLDNLALGVQMHDRATVAEEKNMKRSVWFAVAASARPHGLNRGIGSHEQAKRRALSSCGHILRQEGNEKEHDAICKDRKDCSQSCSG